MAERLHTATTQRLIESPLGPLFGTAPFEALKTRSLRPEFAVTRARAAADLTLGAGPAAFLEEAGGPPVPDLHPRISRALAEFAVDRDEHEAVLERWNDAFWGDARTTTDERVELERERRRVTEQWAKPKDTFGFLAREQAVPPVKYDVPDPEDASARWSAELDSPSMLYGIDTSPDVQRSRGVHGPGTMEYLLRFETPSAYVAGDATARVYEPFETSDALPTLVFNSGLASMNDQLTYWPEEESVARGLAQDGYRVVLPDTPWHGRRELPGFFSGEPYLARAPVAMFQLYAAAAQENGVLVEWARDRGSPAVGVGGMSLGGTVTLHVAGRCDWWPESMRPDFVAPVGMPGAIDRTIRQSRLSRLLDLDDALWAAGWTGDVIHAFSSLLNPPPEPALDPAQVYTFGGRHDVIAPTATARRLLDAWNVPDENRTEWNVGHFGVLVKLLRGSGYRDTVARQLDSFSER
ncbi:MAG: alpha/beta hydrolase [Halobacteriota archaeon]